MKTILVWLVMMEILAASITDEAYRAYRAHDDAKAITLYEKAASKGPHTQRIKAEYNLGVMAIRGRGMSKSRAEALKHFRKAALLGQGILPTYERTRYPKETVKIMIETYRYLARLETDATSRKRAKHNAEALQRLAKESESMTRQKRDEAKARLHRCPEAGNLTEARRRILDDFDCALYHRLAHRFPETMQRHLRLYLSYQERMRDVGGIDPVAREIRTKMMRNLRPVLEDARRREAACQKSASTSKARQTCASDYRNFVAELNGDAEIQPAGQP